MKQAIRMLVAVGVVGAALAACKSKAPEVAPQPQASAPAPVSPGEGMQKPPGHPPTGGEAGAGMPAAAPGQSAGAS